MNITEAEEDYRISYFHTDEQNYEAGFRDWLERNFSRFYPAL